MTRLYKQGEKVIIVSLNKRLINLGFEVGAIHKVWVDYEDLIYLDTPIKSQTSEDYFHREQIKPA